MALCSIIPRPTRGRFRAPRLRHHKATGQACAHLGARAIYLGRYDNPATREKYHRTLAGWMAAGQQQPVPPDQLTVKERPARFWVWAEELCGQPHLRGRGC